jgi:calcium/calmodulin-dependent protein kinase I
MIRLAAEAKERDYWVQQLNEAAQLTIESLYDYDEDVMFGKGRYATVHPAKRKFEKSSDNSYDCTLKIVDKVEFWRRVKKTRERPDTLVREAATQATLSAKCGNVDSILRLSGFFETSENVVLEFEILEGTDLFQYVSKKGVLEELEAAHIMNDIMTGLQTMRRLGIAHRDIKPANVLMCKKEKHGVFVKVADFGMAAFAGVDDLVRGRCGTPGYVAPEIFHAGMNNGYACGVDVFSAGVTLYVLLCGYEPFYGESDAELIEANKDADVDFSESDWDNGES